MWRRVAVQSAATFFGSISGPTRPRRASRFRRRQTPSEAAAGTTHAIRQPCTHHRARSRIPPPRHSCRAPSSTCTSLLRRRLNFPLPPRHSITTRHPSDRLAAPYRRRGVVSRRSRSCRLAPMPPPVPPMRCWRTCRRRSCARARSSSHFTPVRRNHSPRYHL